jgi:hypothetical protein
MQKILNSIEGQRLYELETFHTMLSDDYLSNKDNLQTDFILDQFFKETDRVKALKRLKLLNISYSLPSLITEKFSDYVGDATTTLDLDLDDYISAFIWGGYAVFIPRLVDGIFYVDYCSPDEYVIEDDGTERLLTYYQVYDSQDKVKTYVLEQIYAGNKVVRKLYELQKMANYKNFALEGTLVPLTTIAPTADLDQFETLPNIDFSPLVKVHNRKLVGRKYGTSEIRKVRSLISSIEIEAVNIQDQFLKHLQAKLAMPKSAMKVDKEGNVNIRELEAYGMETGDTLPQFIVNSNPMIDKAFDQIEDFLRQICAILTIPTEFMGLKDGGSAESADTKKIRLVSFIKKVEKIRSKFEDGLKQIDQIRTLWTGQADTQFKIDWPAIFPDDPAELANQLSVAQDARLISNVHAIMRYNNMSEEDAKKEQEEINKEKASFDTTALENNPNQPAAAGAGAGGSNGSQFSK